jgi:hypothetical protein
MSKPAETTLPRLGGWNLLRILFWLIRDTFKQSLASAIFWVLLLVCLGAIIFCLGISIKGGAPQLRGGPFMPAGVGREHPDIAKQRVEAQLTRLRLACMFVGSGSTWASTPGVEQLPPSLVMLNMYAKSLPALPPPPAIQEMENVRGEVSYFFGMISAPLHRGDEEQVKFIHIILGQWVAGVAGLLLAVIFTAGFLPSFLEPNAATILLAKPVPRWLLLLGKFLGVVLFLSLFCGLFILGTWWALYLKTGVYEAGYLWGWPLLVFHFLVVYAFGVLLAVMTRNTTVCVFGTIFFWLLCYGVNYGRHAHVALEVQQMQTELRGEWQGERQGTTLYCRFGDDCTFATAKAPTPIDTVLFVDRIVPYSLQRGYVLKMEWGQQVLELEGNLAAYALPRRMVCQLSADKLHLHITEGDLQGEWQLTRVRKTEPLPSIAVPPRSRLGSALLEFGYLLLPKPIDLIIYLEEAIKAQENFATISQQKEMLTVRQSGAMNPFWSLTSSLLGALLFLAMAAWEFRKMDY